MDCQHWVEGHGIRRTIGREPLLFHNCELKKSVCIDKPDDRAGAAVQVCEKCKADGGGFEFRGSRHCGHLGQVLRQQEADVCGRVGEKFDVYFCPIHGECSLSRYCKHQTIKVCGAHSCGEYSAVKRHYYRSIADEWRDAFRWSRQLPDNIIGFVGVHRSGIGVAQALACSRNVHYVDWEAMISGARPWERTIRRRLGKPHSTDGFVLVVDDTAWSGGTMRGEIKPALAHRTDVEIKYGALYYGINGRSAIDFGFERFDHVRQTFETNLFHDTFTHQQTFDLDGIFCEDCPSSDVDHDERRYLDWMAGVKCLNKPTHPVGQIVTGRLEKYREQTIDWLQRNGIGFKQLIMYSGAESNQARNAEHHKVIEYKARTYAGLWHSTLFVESDEHQAQRIGELTGKSVLAWPSQRYWNCD